MRQYWTDVAWRAVIDSWRWVTDWDARQLILALVVPATVVLLHLLRRGKEQERKDYFRDLWWTLSAYAVIFIITFCWFLAATPPTLQREGQERLREELIKAFSRDVHLPAVPQPPAPTSPTASRGASGARPPLQSETSRATPCLNPVKFTSSLRQTAQGYALHVVVANPDGIVPSTKFLIYSAGGSGWPDLRSGIDKEGKAFFDNLGLGSGVAEFTITRSIPQGRDVSLQLLSSTRPAAAVCIDRFPTTK